MQVADDTQDDDIMGDEEMIGILKEIARSGKSHGARIEAIKQLRAIREQQAEASAPPVPEEKGDGFGSLYDVDNPGRSRRAS